MSYQNLPALAVVLVLLISSNIHAAEKLEEITAIGEALSDAEAELPLGCHLFSLFALGYAFKKPVLISQ